MEKKEKDIDEKEAGSPSEAPIGRSTFYYFAVVAGILIAAALLVLMFYKDDDTKYEDEEIFSFNDVSGTLKIYNPYGVTRILPSKDGQLGIQVNKIAHASNLKYPGKGLPQIESFYKQEASDLDFKLIYHLKKPKILYADLFVYCNPVQRIEVYSESASVWVQDIASDLFIVTEKDGQTTTISNVKGEISIQANEGLIIIEMVDEYPLTLNSNSATNIVVLKGENPGKTSINGTDGQTNLFISKKANAKIITETKGVFFSDLTREQLEIGKERSDGVPVVTQLGNEGNTIHIKHTKGEIVLSKDIPPVVVPSANQADANPESTSSP